MFVDFVGQSYPQPQICISHANFCKIQKLQKFDVSSVKQTLCPQEPVKLLLFINLDPHNLKWFHRSLPEENLVYKLNRVKLFTTFIKNFHKITGGFRLTSWKKQISYTSLEKSKTVLHLKQNLKTGTKCLRKKLITSFSTSLRISSAGSCGTSSSTGRSVFFTFFFTVFFASLSSLPYTLKRDKL